jgi:hypothetical protein
MKFCMYRGYANDSPTPPLPRVPDWDDQSGRPTLPCCYGPWIGQWGRGTEAFGESGPLLNLVEAGDFQVRHDPGPTASGSAGTLLRDADAKCDRNFPEWDFAGR